MFALSPISFFFGLYPMPYKTPPALVLLVFLSFVAALVCLPLGVNWGDGQMWGASAIWLGLGLLVRIILPIYMIKFSTGGHPHGMQGLFEIMALAFYAVPVAISGVVALFMR